jgi:hypothetical protein
MPNHTGLLLPKTARAENMNTDALRVADFRLAKGRILSDAAPQP